MRSAFITVKSFLDLVGRTRHPGEAEMRAVALLVSLSHRPVSTPPPLLFSCRHAMQPAVPPPPQAGTQLPSPKTLPFQPASPWCLAQPAPDRLPSGEVLKCSQSRQRPRDQAKVVLRMMTRRPQIFHPVEPAPSFALLSQRVKVVMSSSLMLDVGLTSL